jgi:CRISPR system Cascade subunit CasA
MESKEFNLLNEPWILLMDQNGVRKEVSIREALFSAHKYSGIQGELPTQDVAVLRLLLAILYSVFLKYDINGEESPITGDYVDAEDIMIRWKELWDNGSIPVKPVQNYLDVWKDRFWLFHPDYPFFQIPEAITGTAYQAAKLNGLMSESSNKDRLFPMRTGTRKEQLEYAEAARWLLYVNSFDDTSAKPKEKGKDSPGVGWLGKLGIVYAEGNNLFETLLLNMVMLKNGQTAWKDGKAAWELEKPHTEERVKIACPDNPAELLTLQSRRLLLKREKGRVVGFSLLGGDFFDEINTDSEQMTAWKMQKKGGKETGDFQPKRHDAHIQIWREFSTLFSLRNARRPGVVEWICLLQNEKMLDGNRMVHFNTASVQYGDKNFFINDVYSDGLSFHLSVFQKLQSENRNWVQTIINEIDDCRKAAVILKNFESDLAKACGREYGAKIAEELYYRKLDRPFRIWLEGFNCGKDYQAVDEYVSAWRLQAKKMAGEVGRDLINESAPAALIGRTVIKENRFYSAPQAYNIFQYKLAKLYPEKNERRE